MSNNFFVSITTWITRLFYLNILWLSFTLVGIVIFGFFPATTAAFSIMRQWLLDREDKKDFSLWKTFLDYYKKDFINANMVGIILILTSVVVFLDLRFLDTIETDNLVGEAFQFFFLTISIILFVAALYVFPVFVHFELNLFQVIKNSLFFAITSPLPSTLMAIGSLLVVFITLNFPGLFLVFSLSLMIIVLMGPALKAFKKLE